MAHRPWRRVYTPPDWMAASSQVLSPVTILVVALGPGLVAFVAVQAMLGYWVALGAFFILEAVVLVLVRRDFLRRKRTRSGPSSGDVRKDS